MRNFLLALCSLFLLSSSNGHYPSLEFRYPFTWGKKNKNSGDYIPTEYKTTLHFFFNLRAQLLSLFWDPSGIVCIPLYVVQFYVFQALRHSECCKGRSGIFLIPSYGSCFTLPNELKNLCVRKVTQISCYKLTNSYRKKHQINVG